LSVLDSRLADLPLFPERHALAYFKIERNILKSKIEQIRQIEVEKLTFAEIEAKIPNLEWLEKLVMFIKMAVYDPLTPHKITMQAEARARK
jgi:hypothetical protein